MPSYMLLIRPIFRVAWQEKPVAIEVNQLLAGNAFFDEFLAIDHNPVIVADGPEATVELPVGVLGKRKTIARVVVAAEGGDQGAVLAAAEADQPGASIGLV